MTNTRNDKKKLTRRQMLKTTAGVAAVAGTVNMFNINHVWSKDVIWDGEPFDAGGATIRIHEWGGFWQEFMKKSVLNDFEKTYNCKVAYDASFPWFPKYVASGPKDPAFHAGNFNLNEIIKLNRIDDYFLKDDELIDNLPNAKDCWDFTFGTGVGVTWGFGQFAHVWRTDLVDPAPVGFKSFWEERFANKRSTYVTSNALFQVFFMTACAEFGSGPKDIEAGYEAMRKAMPMKISDFTGNMQTLIERGEIHMGVQWEGEVLLQKDKGIKVEPIYWDNKPILTQSHVVSRYSDPMEKKLALAMVNAKLDPAFQNKAADTFYLRPSNKNTVLPERLTKLGVTNSADAMGGLQIPDWNWYLDNEEDIVETVNEIFSS